jgi:hypothetical protein
MDEKELILLTIGTDGSIQAETKGIKGEKCLQSISALEDMLDSVTLDSKYTQEFYDSTTSQQMKLGNHDNT